MFGKPVPHAVPVMEGYPDNRQSDGDAGGTRALTGGPHVDVEEGDPGHGEDDNVVPRLSGTPGRIRHTGPALNQDGREVLLSLGFSLERIEDRCGRIEMSSR
jgi:hypothetical protein